MLYAATVAQLPSVFWDYLDSALSLGEFMDERTARSESTWQPPKGFPG